MGCERPARPTPARRTSGTFPPPRAAAGASRRVATQGSRCHRRAASPCTTRRRRRRRTDHDPSLRPRRIVRARRRSGRREKVTAGAKARTLVEPMKPRQHAVLSDGPNRPDALPRPRRSRSSRPRAIAARRVVGASHARASPSTSPRCSRHAKDAGDRDHRVRRVDRAPHRAPGSGARRTDPTSP